MNEPTVNGHEKAWQADAKSMGQPHAATALDVRGEVQYLTSEQAAALLQVHPKTLTRWAARDATLPVLRIAGTVRYPKERLCRWLRDREQGRPASRQPSRNRVPPTRNGASVEQTT